MIQSTACGFMFFGVRRWSVLSSWAAIAISLSLAGGAFAQKPAAPPPNPPTSPPRPAAEVAASLEAGGTPAAATVEKIMEEAVRNISRRYNLNEAQVRETDTLMKREVRKFLKDHEAEVWPVIRDLLAAQFGGKPPEAPEAMRIGKSARPLVGLAKDAIVKANEEWRMYLNTDQKSMHDYDMAEMDKTFQKIEKNFNDWASGQPTDAGLFPPPPPEDLSPARPKKPTPGLPDPEVEVFRVSIFDTFVEEFIKENQLDPGQIDSARSILKEFKAKANDFKKARKAELSKIAAAQRTALEARDREKMAAAEADRKKLLEPVQALIGEMEERLKGLLTTGQLERYVSRRPAAAKPVEVATEAPVAKPPPAALPEPANAAPSNPPDAPKKGDGN